MIFVETPRCEGGTRNLALELVHIWGCDSPFQATKAIKMLVANHLKEPNLTDPDLKICEILDQNTYVDDLTITANTCDETFQLYQGVTKLLARANFHVKNGLRIPKDFCNDWIPTHWLLQRSTCILLGRILFLLTLQP